VLQLYVFDPSEEFDEAIPPSTLRANEYLQRTPSWRPESEDTFLLLDPSIGVSLLPINAFGFLEVTAAQLAEASVRLANKQRALLRTSFEARPIYVALEPAGDVVELSVLAPLPYAMEYDPLPPGPFSGGVDHRAELHAYVDAHRDELRPGAVPDTSMNRQKRRLQRIRLPAAGLPEALHAEAIAGLRLYKHLSPTAKLPKIAGL
jgi:hypothetical protein